MPGHPILEPLTSAELDVLDANDRPDGHRTVVTDAGETEWEARGADGARVWVELHTGHVADHEAAEDPHGQYLTAESGRWEVLVDGDPPTALTTDDDWLYAWVGD